MSGVPAEAPCPMARVCRCHATRSSCVYVRRSYELFYIVLWQAVTCSRRNDDQGTLRVRVLSGLRLLPTFSPPRSLELHLTAFDHSQRSRPPRLTACVSPLRP